MNTWSDKSYGQCEVCGRAASHRCSAHHTDGGVGCALALVGAVAFFSLAWHFANANTSRVLHFNELWHSVKAEK
jgi:hypothetical protein